MDPKGDFVERQLTKLPIEEHEGFATEGYDVFMNHHFTRGVIQLVREQSQRAMEGLTHAYEGFRAGRSLSDE